MSRRRSVAVLATVVVLQPVVSQRVAVAAQGTAPPTTKLSALGVRDINVRGTSATATAFVTIPPGYDVRGGTVDLHYEHSPLLLASRSTITVVAGDRPVTSAKLTRATASGGHLRFRLPALRDVDGGIVLSARFAMRLTDDRCEDPQNPALWARLRADSTVAPLLVPARRSLADMPRTLVPGTPDTALTVQLASRPTAGELEAAGTAAAAVGRAAAVRNVDPLVLMSRQAPTDGPSVAVAAGSRLTSLLDPGRALPTGSGLGALLVVPGGPPRLVIGGSDDVGVRRAASALTPGRLTPLTGTTARVSAAPPLAPRRATAWRERTASFAQLGLPSREIVGAGTQTLDLVVDRPPQWRIKDGAVLDLRVDAGAALATGRSGVTVIVAGYEVGTRRLHAASGIQRLRFKIPEGIVDTDLSGRAVRRIPISLRFDLDPTRTPCEAVDDSGLRVAVLATSSLTLPHDDTDAQDLSRFPAPLAVPGRGVDIVVPRSPSEAELTAGLQLAAAVGRWSDPATPLPRLVTSAGLGRKARNGHGLILVNRADRDLGRQISVTGETLGGRGDGLLALRDSPWADGRTVLVVRGDAEGVVRASRAVTRADVVRRLAGRGVRVAPGPQALSEGSPQAGPPVALAPVPDAGLGEDVPVWAVPSGVVLLALVATAGLLGRRRWGGRRRV